jgi:nucleoside-diphosphate-sugar epimerase
VVADALDPDQVAEAVGRARPDVIVHELTSEAGVVMMTEARGASNAKATRELSWRPAHPTWRQGFAAA